MASVDVLMPFRDAEPWICRAWQSLRRQELRDWRLVAVDDGSRDRGAEALRRAARDDPRLLLIRAPARGVAAALNRGLAEVRAPVVVRMDADDLSLPSRLGRLLRALEENPGWHGAASRVRLFPPGRVTPAMARYVAWQNGLVSPGAIARERYVECTATHATLAVRTEVLVGMGGWWEGPGPEDLDLLLRWHRLGLTLGKVPEVLYLWRERAGRETRTSPRMSREAFLAVKARHLAAELALRGQTEVRVFGRGRSLGAWVGALARRGVRAEAVEWRAGSGRPRWSGLALFCFGAPGVRARVRRELGGHAEGTDYLFVS